MLFSLFLGLVVACSEPEPLSTGPCAMTEECVLALDLAACCSCPVAVLASSLEGREDYVAYEAGRDYADAKQVDCSDVVCGGCVTAEATCSDEGECVSVPDGPG